MNEIRGQNETRRILVVQTAFLGDVLLGLPLFKRLRARFPQARLTLLCRKGVGSFFLSSGVIDVVVEVDKSTRGGWAHAHRVLSDQTFDLLLCPHESFRTALFVRGVKARRKIGYARFFNRFVFSDRVKRPLDLPEALRQLTLLEPLESADAPESRDHDVGEAIERFRRAQARAGGQEAAGGPSQSGLVDVPAGTDMKVPRLMQIRNARHVGRAAAAMSGDAVSIASVAEPFFDADERVVVLAPGSVWPTKMWTKDGFIEVGRTLSRDALVVVMGSREESELCAEIARSIPNATSLAGRTSLWESAQLLAVADLLICNDSGAMHLGAAAGVPIVSVFGPTVLEFGYRPWSSNAAVVQTDLACRPCGKHGAKTCPLGHHDCMRKVLAADVLKAAKTVAPIG